MFMALETELEEHVSVCRKLPLKDVRGIADAAILALRNGNKILLCGNGGSAADAQHFSAELVGRYKKERRGLPAIALTTDSSAVTAISNDYGYDMVFSRQVEALGAKGDMLILISTSGNSQNLLEAAAKAKEKGIKTIGLLGKGGGKLLPLCDLAVVVPSDNTPRIQEMHGMAIHMICGLIEDGLFKGRQ
jgi:D-sedoheptulose 7-phosphate isomerase